MHWWQRKGKRKRIEGTDEEDNVQPVVQEPPPRQPLDPSILNNSILTSVLTPPDEDLNINPDLLVITNQSSLNNIRLSPWSSFVDTDAIVVDGWNTVKHSSWRSNNFPSNPPRNYAIWRLERSRATTIGTNDSCWWTFRPLMNCLILNEEDVRCLGWVQQGVSGSHRR